MVSFMVFVFGLSVGSFLNAYIYRMEVREGLVLTLGKHNGKHKPSVWSGRSFCPRCEHILAWYDLIPLLSFALLRGKCRYCGQKISWQYPLVEMAAGLLFVTLFWFSVPWLGQGVENLISLSFTWAIGAMLIAIFTYDLKHFLIPDILVYSAVGAAALWRIIEFFNLGNFGSLLYAIVAGFGASAFFLSIYLVSKGKLMGFGDVKLALLLGLFLGWPSVLVALFFAFCLGAVVGLLFIALKKKELKSEVPFAPFLIVGAALAFFFGADLFRWYLALFLV